MSEATEVAALTESVVQGKRLRENEDDAIDGLLGKSGLRSSQDFRVRPLPIWEVAISKSKKAWLKEMKKTLQSYWLIVKQNDKNNKDKVPKMRY